MTHEQFKQKIKSAYCKTVTILLVFMIIYIIKDFVTIVSDENVRVIDINFPFYQTQFYQDIKK